MAEDAITLVREQPGILPLRKVGTTGGGLPYQNGVEVRNHLLVVIITDDVRLDSGRALERQIKLRVPDANVIYTDSALAPAMASGMFSAVQQAEKVVVAVYASPSAGRVVNTGTGAHGSASLAEENMVLLHNILKIGARKSIVLAMGNPYLAKDFPEVQNYLCAFSAAQVAETSAVKALFGEIEIHGRLPVTIPGIALRGVGIDAPARQ
jgi:beta-N-acetylhexosaminidase